MTYKSKILIFGIMFVLGLFLLPGRSNAIDTRVVNFSGYNWTVKSGQMGPHANLWNDSEGGVYVDGEGQLHLRVARRNGQWHSAEVYLPASLGYGTYEFEVATPVNTIDTNLVAATFLYENDAREFDIEFTNWQRQVMTNSQYVVQPFPPFSNIRRFDLFPSAGPTVHRIRWTQNDGISFSSWQNGIKLQEWRYTDSNFAPGGERVHINFWMINRAAPSDGQEKEFVVRRFNFTPFGSEPGMQTNAGYAIQPNSGGPATQALNLPADRAVGQVQKPSIKYPKLPATDVSRPAQKTVIRKELKLPIVNNVRFGGKR